MPYSDPEQRSAYASYYQGLNKTRLRRYLKGYHLKAKYGITRTTYETMCAKQNNMCAICDSPPTGAGSGNLVVDHCHMTGTIRGLLCGECNSAIGLLKDDPEVARRMAAYLNGELSCLKSR